MSPNPQGDKQIENQKSYDPAKKQAKAKEPGRYLGTNRRRQGRTDTNKQTGRQI